MTVFSSQSRMMSQEICEQRDGFTVDPEVVHETKGLALLPGRFDKRARHRIFSEPVALDVVNDATALTQRALKYLEASHWIALGYADAELVKGITVAFECLQELRALSRSAAGLIEQSVPVDPYGAVQYAGVEAA